MELRRFAEESGTTEVCGAPAAGESCHQRKAGGRQARKKAWLFVLDVVDMKCVLGL